MAEKRKNPHRYREAKPLANKGWTKFFFYLDQLTWGLTVNLVGAVVFLICKTPGNEYIMSLFSRIGVVPMAECARVAELADAYG